MKGFNYDTNKTKKAAQARKQELNSRGGQKYFDSSKPSSVVLILPGLGDAGLFFNQTYYNVFAKTPQGDRLIGKSGLPPAGKKDKIRELAFKVHQIAKDSDNKNHKNFARKLWPTNECLAQILDLNNLEVGPQVYRVPSKIEKIVLDEIDEVSSIAEICGLDEGHQLKIKHNGEKGINREYTSVKFDYKAGPVNLLADGQVKEEEILDQMIDLSTLKVGYNEEQYEAIYAHFCKIASKMGIDGKSEDADDFADGFTEESEDDEPVQKVKKPAKKVVDDDADFVMEDEEEEAPRKPAKKAPAKKFVVDEDEEEEVPAKPEKKAPAKKFVVDEDEEEEEAPRKPVKQAHAKKKFVAEEDEEEEAPAKPAKKAPAKKAVEEEEEDEFDFLNDEE